MTRRPRATTPDPETAAVMAELDHWSRRGFLVRSGVALGGLALGPAFVAACGDDKQTTSTPGGTAAELKDTTLLTVSNWTAYIDKDESGNVKAPGSTIDRFEKETGITVTYNEDFNDNNEQFNKVFSPNLSKGRPIGADITTPTSWMVARLAGLGWLEKLPLDKIPNHKNLLDEYLSVDWDPGATMFMPWFSGISGIAYNAAKTGRELKSWNDLLDPAFKGRVAMLTELRDTIGLGMLAMGKDPSAADMDAANDVLDKLDAETQSGQIAKFTGNEYLGSLENGDFVACMAWSGDLATLNNPDIKFVIPEEGAMRFFDCMCVPKGAANVSSAAKWMNFVYDPVNAAKLVVGSPYISAVKGVRDELIKLGGDAAALADNEILFPDEATSKRLKVFWNLSEDDEAALNERFNKITGG